MKKLCLVLLLGQLAWAKPVLDLEKPAWTVGQLRRTDRAKLSAEDRFGLDCRLLERMPQTAERGRLFTELRKRSQAFGPGPARARFLWACAVVEPDKPKDLRSLRAVLAEPGLSPRFQMYCFRRSWSWAESQEDRSWFLSQARELSPSRDEWVPPGWLETNLEFSDGKLALKQLSQLSLAEHSLVCLSCCQGGTSDRQELEEPVTLATGFSAAGAETVVGHLWQVDDEAARLFFRAFYQELARGSSPSRSFRQAQTVCRAAFPKPRDWAGFFLLGNPN